MRYIILTFFFLVSTLEIFSQGLNFFIVGNIHIEGNDATRRKIILRELTFFTGDTISFSDWAKEKTESVENLLNSSLFHSVSINLEDSSRLVINVSVEVLERWYLWPAPVLSIDERNFNSWWQTKNFDRVSYGMFLTKQNFRGRMEEVKVLAMLGHNKQLGLSYDAPYLNKKKTFGAGGEVVWTLLHEVKADVRQDKQVYMKIDDPIQKDLLLAFHLRLRPNYNVSHLLQFRYEQYWFNDSLVNNYPVYTTDSLSKIQYLGVYYKLKVDQRDYKSYPLKGYYWDMEFWKHGLGLFDFEDVNHYILKSTFRKYWQLNKNFYVALGGVVKFSGKEKQPQFFQDELGYGRDFVRGFELNVIEGERYFVAKSNIKYALYQKVHKFGFVPSSKFNTVPFNFYLNAFADAGYVANYHPKYCSSLCNRLIYSVGLGLDFATYYDKVARFEVTLNSEMQAGFFVHFIAPL